MKPDSISPNGASSRQDIGYGAGTGPLSSCGTSHYGPGRCDAPLPHLTPRQLEVLALLCEGLPNKLICRRLKISAGTVKVHIGSILREFGVSSRLQAVVSARRCGLDFDGGVGTAHGDDHLAAA